MNSIADAPSLLILFAYGLLILTYLIILRLMMKLLQQLANKHRAQRSVSILTSARRCHPIWTRIHADV